MPIGMSRRNGTPSSSSSSITSFSTILACRSSISVQIIGNMIRTSPSTLARMIARSCRLNIGMSCRHIRMLRSPRNGLRSGFCGLGLRVLVGPEVERADDQRLAVEPAQRRRRRPRSGLPRSARARWRGRGTRCGTGRCPRRRGRARRRRRAGNSMFACRLIGVPVRGDRPGRSRSVAELASRARSNCLPASRCSASCSASGLTITTPRVPSMMTVSPPLTSAGDVAQPDDGGDAHRAGDDRRVAGAAADVGGEAVDVLAVERGGLARAAGRGR